MEILNNYWGLQTVVFAVIFTAVVFVSTQKKTDAAAISKETSNELRGLAILGILFAHLAYGRFSGTEFLFPLAIWAGPAVNLFFFLSGYGLAASAIAHGRTLKDFYQKRLVKIYLPLWIFLIIILIADALILNRQYPWQETLSAFFGFFPEADLFSSINSPLWFLTPLLFYYLVFPIIFRARHRVISVLAVFAVSALAFFPFWPVSEQILKFYQLHWLAFPAGVLTAALIIPQLKKIRPLPSFWRYVLLIMFAGLAWQTAYHSGVGRGVWLEQGYALVTMLCVVMFFEIKKTKFNFLEIVGICSFEIYLWHWPLVSRYGIFYNFLPPWLATALYLPLLLLVAYVFHQSARLLENRIRH